MTSPADTLAPSTAGGGGLPRTRPVGRAAAWAAVLVVTFTGVVGSNLLGVRDYFFDPATPDATPPALGRVAGDAGADRPAAAPTSLRSQPWWQVVKTIEGSGTTTAPAFTVAASAAQWRVQGTCETGRIVVSAPSQARPVVDRTCPGEVTGFSSRPGSISLQVTADGPWRLTVAQQLDTPLVEPLTPAMTAPGSRAIASGSFYGIDKSGTGRVTVYEQADGRYSVRLEGFYVSPNADLQLRFSSLEAPRTSEEYLSAKSEFIVVMDVTAGSLNYTVPAGGDPTLYKSVVVWCGPVNSAYAAASLGPVQ